jgi:hypothetical protein
MARDRLLLLQPGFTNPQRPDGPFVCQHCLPIEGLLAGSPAQAAGLDIERVDFPRPRPRVVAALDEAHQGLPVLILGDEHPVPDDAQALGEVRFVNDTRRILALLAERHGFPQVH